MRPVATLLCLSLLLLTVRAETPPPAAEKPVLLTPYAVKDDPVNSYAFDVRILADKATRKISHLIITRVPVGSDAEREGLEVGDEIIQINGTKVTEMEARVDPDSLLGRAMVNRSPGTELDLEVIVHRQRSVTLRAIKNRPGL
jgi:predicted metalloprotease with PDZ domain